MAFARTAENTYTLHTAIFFVVSPKLRHFVWYIGKPIVAFGDFITKG
jgi:hypothetical protein